MDSRDEIRERAPNAEEGALREVLAIERQAQGSLRDAEAEARRVLASAAHHAQELREAAEADLEQHTRQAHNDAQAEIDRLTGAIGAQAESAVQAWLQEAEPRIADALRHVVQAVTLDRAD
jgi:vacuolar-type H+-ATPase subunit H